MKKIIYIFSLFITVIGLLGSCINLESESYDSINTTIFPTNADDADALVIAADEDIRWSPRQPLDN